MFIMFMHDLNRECCLSLAYIATHILVELTVEEIFNNAWAFHT